MLMVLRERDDGTGGRFWRVIREVEVDRRAADSAK
jgi:hypothetical protein